MMMHKIDEVSRYRANWYTEPKHLIRFPAHHLFCEQTSATLRVEHHCCNCNELPNLQNKQSYGNNLFSNIVNARYKNWAYAITKLDQVRH
jgi:hypothetical protein